MAKAKKKPAKKKPAKKRPAQKITKKKAAPKKAAPKKVQKKVAPKKVTPQKAAPKSNANIKPLADRIVVELEGPSERTAGGLYIPQTVGERPNKGLVLAVGRGGQTKRGHLKPLDVKKGDSILFNLYAGVPATIDGKEVLILQESEVLGVISN